MVVAGFVVFAPDFWGQHGQHFARLCVGLQAEVATGRTSRTTVTKVANAFLDIPNES
jgi:hypothetical protein